MPSPVMQNNVELRRFQRRSIVCAIGIFFLFVILFVRLFYLQIVEHHFYNTLSERNFINVIPVTPVRGMIYDRNGVVLAKNTPVYNLTLTMDRVKDLENTLNILKTVVNLSDEEIKAFRRIQKQFYPYQEIPLKQQLTEEEVDHFYVNQYRLAGITIQTNMKRSYPLANAMSTAVGYVGRITTREFAEVDPTNYVASDIVGKSGVEAEDEVLLHGKMGSEQAEIDANGKIVRIIKVNPATPGDNLTLSIDSKLQIAAEQAMGDNAGAVVALDPSSGQVLALVSAPTYDPNVFSGRMTQAQYKAIIESPSHPLFNRVTRATYAPGSTVKPFISFGALDEGVIDTQDYVLDQGWFRLPNTDHIFHNWKKNGFGWVNVTKAIMFSCDTFFYQLAVVLGINRLDHALMQFGFGEVTGINLPAERAGIVPSPEWKEKNIGQKWYAGDTVVAGIGQGYIVATPIQLAKATAIMATHGLRFQPNILLKLQQPNGITTEMQPIAEPPLQAKNPKAWDIVIDAMQQVAMNPLGTAYPTFRNISYTIAGKSGTAQVNRQTEENTTTLNDHLFIAFAPVKDPKIVVAAVVERTPGMSQAGVRVAKTVIEFYLNELKEQAANAQSAQTTQKTTTQNDANTKNAEKIQQDLKDDLQQEMRMQKAAESNPSSPEQLETQMEMGVNQKMDLQTESDSDEHADATNEKSTTTPAAQSTSEKSKVDNSDTVAADTSNAHFEKINPPSESTDLKKSEKAEQQPDDSNYASGDD